MDLIERKWAVLPELSFKFANLAGLMIVLGFLYLLSLSFYRLYLSPAAKFPGPKLAALTFWYEFYHDVRREGQYTWKIRDLHRQYGMRLKLFFSIKRIGS